MHLLVVHHDAEIGEQLVRMIEEYTAHECDLLASDEAALEWARARRDCSILLVELSAPGIDGLALGGSLGELFLGLQTIFLPAYAASEQRLEVPNPKVFPEPIDGERLLKAIDRAAAAPYRGLDLFHVVDVLQMCCLSGRSGALQIVKGSRTALVFLREGQIVHAERGSARDLDALAEMVAWESVEFAYDQSVRPPAESIKETWDQALIEAVLRHKGQGSATRSSPRELRGAEVPPEVVKRPKRGLFSGLRRS